MQITHIKEKTLIYSELYFQDSTRIARIILYFISYLFALYLLVAGIYMLIKPNFIQIGTIIFNVFAYLFFIWTNAFLITKFIFIFKYKKNSLNIAWVNLLKIQLFLTFRFKKLREHNYFKFNI